MPDQNEMRYRSSSAHAGGRRLLMAILLAIIVCVGAFWVMKEAGTTSSGTRDASAEIDAYDYSDLARIPELCPALAGMVRQATADSVVRNSEADAIRAALVRRAKAWNEASTMRDAKLKLGMTAPTLPPRCESADGDAPMSELLESHTPRP